MKRLVRFIDPYLFFSVMGLFIMGALMIYSASRGTDSSNFNNFFVSRQLLYGLVGLILMVSVARLNLSRVYKLTPLIYISGVLALVFILAGLGKEHRGSRAWFDIGSYQLQPSEFVKLALILALAAFIYKCRGAMHFPGLVAAIAIAGLPAILILLQPDAGTFFIYGVITLTMLVVGGLKKRLLITLLMATVLVLALVINAGVLKDFQERRLSAFINPSDPTSQSYTQTQAQIAIGNGGFTGQGFGNGVQTRGNLVPEQHTDFIFTVIGEELGFLGSFTTVALFAILLGRIWYLSRFCQNMFGMLVLVGIMSMILFQAFESIGMALGIMPITGIPLPFVSYGGSSLVTSFISIGMVMSVANSSSQYFSRSSNRSFSLASGLLKPKALKKQYN